MWRAWYTVALLCLIAALSFLDRYIVALLAQPIITELALDTTDIGLLIGLGFGLLYSVSSVPIAHLLDRGRRVRIVGAGVIVWSLATIASGFAQDFGTLLATRAGVAIGEAVLVPATVSLIADLFARDRRALPIGLFMAVSTLMGSGAFLIGGVALDIATQLSPATGLAPWRLTLVLVGAPGLLLGGLWLATIAEPPRVDSVGTADEASLSAAAAHIRERAHFYFPFLLSFGVSAVASYSFITWTSTVLVRSYGLAVAEAGRMFGLVGVIAGALAAIAWPAIGARAMRRGDARLALAALALGLGMGHAALAMFALAPGVTAAAAVIAVATIGYGAGGGLAVLIVQQVAPPRMRARITSLYMLLGNLLGLTCGPGLTAWISETHFVGADALRQALIAVALTAGPATVVLLTFAMLGYRRHAASPRP